MAIKVITPKPQEVWDEYKKRVYGGELAAIQEKECSACFFAGVEAGIKLLKAVDSVCIARQGLIQTMNPMIPQASGVDFIEAAQKANVTAGISAKEALDIIQNFRKQNAVAGQSVIPNPNN